MADLIGLASAARRLRYTYHRTWDQAARGDFGEVVEREGKLFLERAAVEQYLANRDRTTAPATG